MKTHSQVYIRAHVWFILYVSVIGAQQMRARKTSFFFPLGILNRARKKNCNACKILTCMPSLPVWTIPIENLCIYTLTFNSKRKLKFNHKNYERKEYLILIK